MFWVNMDTVRNLEFSGVVHVHQAKLQSFYAPKNGGVRTAFGKVAPRGLHRW